MNLSKVLKSIELTFSRLCSKGRIELTKNSWFFSLGHVIIPLQLGMQLLVGYNQSTSFIIGLFIISLGWTIYLLRNVQHNKKNRSFRPLNIRLLIGVDTLIYTSILLLPTWQWYDQTWVVEGIILLYAAEYGIKATSWFGLFCLANKLGFHLIQGNLMDSLGKVASFLFAMCTIIFFIGFATDKLYRVAYFDSLTMLPNRLMFKQRLQQAIEAAKQNHKELAVMFLDLNRFKNINDTFGHDVGDKLLAAVSKRINDYIGDNNTLSRLGGDEFTILMTPFDHSSDTIRFAEDLSLVFKQPWIIEGLELHITTSIGIAMYPLHGEDVSTLMKNADKAMYHSKKLGIHYAMYDLSTNDLLMDPIQLETSLRHALKRDELEVYYQPKINISTGNMIGCEALLRWKHPTLGYISPLSFIPIAEESGLIIPIGEWVLRKACAQHKAWIQAGLPALGIAVNFSARQFQQQNLLEIIKEVVHETQIDCSYLEIEITESIAMHNVDYAITTMKSLKEMGIKIAIDDFGTAYSSLNYLIKFPVDSLKIDQSFVREIITNNDQAIIVTIIILMAKRLNLKVIAEGIETWEQLDFLMKHNCDEGQGYYFREPVPADLFAQNFLTSFNSLYQAG